VPSRHNSAPSARTGNRTGTLRGISRKELSLRPARPNHVITRDEVSRWLADSAVKTVTYHRTTAAAARRILERGVEIAASRIGSYGQGFYTTTEADPFHGDAELVVAMRTRTPLRRPEAEIADFADGVARELRPTDPRITPDVAAEIRRRLIRLGYDGIIALDAGGDGVDYVIALRGEMVRVVVD
jgi:hypothetical protein